MALCTVNLTVVDQTDNPVSNVPVTFVPQGSPSANVQLSDPFTVFSSGTSSPNLIIELQQGRTYFVNSGTATSGPLVVPNSSSFTPTNSIWSYGAANQTPPSPSTMAALAANTPTGNLVITGSMGQVGDSGLSTSLANAKRLPPHAPMTVLLNGSIIISSSPTTSVPGDGSLNTINWPTPASPPAATLSYDEMGIFDPANPTKITIPAGVGRVDIGVFAQWDKPATPASQSYTYRLKPSLNGGPISPMAPGMIWACTPDVNTGDSHLTQNWEWVLGIIPAPGDFWIINAINTSGQTCVLSQSGFAMRFWA